MRGNFPGMAKAYQAVDLRLADGAPVTVWKWRENRWHLVEHYEPDTEL